MPRSVRPAPLSLRLSDAERAQLVRRAGNAPISTYVKSVLFDDTTGARRRRRVTADQALLAQLLGQLGASGLAMSLKRLAAAADTGSLYLDDLTIREIHNACDDVRGMHLHLLKALGKKLPDAPAKTERLSVQF